MKRVQGNFPFPPQNLRASRASPGITFAFDLIMSGLARDCYNVRL